MIDRTPIAPFGRPRPIRHFKPHFWGSTGLVLVWFWELLIHIPGILSLRSVVKQRKSATGSPRVLIYSDNLDEVNGIAINSRQVTALLRERGHEIQLMGSAYHTRTGGFVERCGAIMLPQVYSMEQMGYSESELAIPSLGEWIAWMRRNPVDLVEIETPATGGMMIALAAKMAGIRVISHYRTDIYAYVTTLVSNIGVRIWVRFWVKWFNRLTAPVIVPSSYFHEKVQRESGLDSQNVRYLDRGIPLQSFGPAKAQGVWERFLPESHRIRFLFVGRVSLEKELEFLMDLWSELRQRGDVEWLVVGQGPFLNEMQERCREWPEVAFAGKLFGDDLYSIYAEAHYFMFPSGSDTFGNVVVEALASGTPAIVSDSGGPRDIVDAWSGWVVPYKNRALWLQTLHNCADLPRRHPDTMHRYVEGALTRSKQFEIGRAAGILWDFYREILKR
jgi:glycosyltransferase involved in cell wall biosynthesis